MSAQASEVAAALQDLGKPELGHVFVKQVSNPLSIMTHSHGTVTGLKSPAAPGILLLGFITCLAAAAARMRSLMVSASACEVAQAGDTHCAQTTTSMPARAGLPACPA